MARIMGDAIHDNVPALAAIKSTLQLVAGYVTGSSDIVWTAADKAEFAGLPLVTIDQGSAGSPVPGADVRDVQTGAWAASSAVETAGWTAARPTIYCNLDTLPQVTAAGWRGDVWLADWTGTPPSSPPSEEDVTVVAVQYASLADYDLSVVFDPYWPALAPAEDAVITLPGIPGTWVQIYSFVFNSHVLGLGTDGHIYLTKYTNGTWVNPSVVV